ncbi:hypothetical protein F4802DRAFT_600195 [Xylaria palmicola]|nr:hypothetical protein F4802DRAFT_600195 [Xylaria palmicola]
MNSTKSWFQKARAHTLKSSKHDNGSSSATSDQSDQNGQNGQPAAPAVGKSLTELLYKPATVEGHPPMIPQVINAYNLDWWELEPYLKKIYHEVTFKENLAVEDHYLVYVPFALTCEQRDEINEIRKQHRAREKTAAGGGQLRARAEHSPDGPRRPIDDDD